MLIVSQHFFNCGSRLFIIVRRSAEHRHNGVYGIAVALYIHILLNIVKFLDLLFVARRHYLLNIRYQILAEKVEV